MINGGISGIPYFLTMQPGVLNDTIIPGYGVTKMPVNLVAFNALPDGTTRNFGGSTQYVQYGKFLSPMERMLAFQFTSPNHISQWNPMLIGFPGITQLSNQYQTDPALANLGFQMAYQQGYQMRMQANIKSCIQTIAQSLSSMENGLKNLLKSKKLSDADKAKIKEALELVEAKKQEIEDKLKNNPSVEELEEIQEDILALQKQVSKMLKGLEGVSSEDSDDDTVDTDEDDDNNNEDGIDPETGKPSSLTTPTKSEARDFCTRLHNALDTIWGTDNDEIKALIPTIDENNIIEYIDQWGKTYGKDNTGCDNMIFDNGSASLLARLIDDLGHFEKKEYVPMIMNALVARAEALGIDEDKYENNINAITKELSKWVISDKNLVANLQKIVDVIKAKEASNKTDAQKAKKTKQADKEKSIKEKKNETIAEKKAEFARDMKKALKLDKTPEISSKLVVKTDSNGNFTGYEIEIEGCKYRGATYSELVKKLKEQDLDPETCLIKQKLDREA